MDRKYNLMQGDCIAHMATLDDKSIDMILCDLPYGTTDCPWDSVIPFDKLWEQYERIIKDDGAIVLFGCEPFSSLLRTSNLKLYKYDWKWDKITGANFLNIKYQPLKNIEDIMVFSKGRITNGTRPPIKYHPQGVNAFCETRVNIADSSGTFESSSIKKGKEYTSFGENYPKCVLTYKKDTGGLHPTQKPVELLEYLVRTYSDKGDVVLDNCMGSGSTGVACMNTGRKFIGMEMNEEYFKSASRRIEDSIPFFKR